MDFLKVISYNNDVISSSPIHIAKTGEGNSKSIKQVTQYLGSKNTTTNDNICKTCKKRCHGHVGTINVLNPINHQNYPIFRSFFANTTFVKRFLKLVCPFCENVNTVRMSEILVEAGKKETVTPEIKQIFYNELENLMKKKNRCGQPACEKAYTSFKYKDGVFSYLTKEKQVILDFDRVYRLFTRVSSRAFIILLNDVYFNIDDLFFKFGIPITSTTARYLSTFNNNVNELFSKFYKQIVMLSAKISVSNTSELKIYQNALAKMLNSSTKKQLSTYSPKQSTPSIAVFILGNDKHSVINHKVIGGTKYPSGSAVASAKSDGKVTQVHVSREFANGLLYADICCVVTRKIIEKRLKENKYRYLIRFKKGENIIYNLTESVKIDIQDGDMLLRHLETGDVLIVTRFPTLSRYSSLAFEIVVHDDNNDMTIRYPIPAVVMLNVDFDGDKLYLYTYLNASSIVDLLTILSTNACLLNEMTGAFMLGVVQENQIILNTILKIKNIPKKIAYILMGEDIDLLEEEKEFYSGKELFSSFIPNEVTFPGLFENGVIVKDHLLGKEFGANSINSIFTHLSQCLPSFVVMSICESLNNFGYRIAYYHGHCIRIDHLIPDHLSYIHMKNEYKILFDQYEAKLESKIREIEEKKRLINSKIFYREVTAVIEELESETKDMLDRFLNEIKKQKTYNFYKDEINYFFEMVHQELKVKQSNLSTIYISRGRIKDPVDFTPGVNGKTTIYNTSNQFTLDSIGFSFTSHIEGGTVSDSTLNVSRKATTQFQDINQKTADIGTINKKQLKLAQHIRTNHNRSMLNSDNLITPIANELGVLPKDLTRVKITQPDEDFKNYDLLLYYYEQIEELLSYVDAEKGYIVRKEILFYFQPYSFIRMYHDSNKFTDEKEYNPQDDIINFWNRIRNDYFFMLRPVDDLIYMSLLYFDPSKKFLSSFVPAGYDPILKITRSFWKMCEAYVEHQLKYSILTSLNGVQCATAIQAVSTQQALSAHQPISRMGNIINSNFVNDFLTTLRLRSKPSDVLILHSSKKKVLIEILRKFHYVTLNILEATVDFVKIENRKSSKRSKNNKIRCNFQIPIINLQREMMTITDLWQMLSINLSELNYLNSFTILFDIRDGMCYVMIDIIFVSYENYDKDLTQLEIDIKSFNKGRENNFLSIVKISKKYFKLELELRSFQDLQLINTQDVSFTKIPLNFTKSMGNLKLHSTVRDELIALTDPSLIFPLQVLVDAQYSSKSIKPLKMKSEPNKILTACTFESPSTLAESVLKSYKDDGHSIESSSFQGKSSKIGKTEYEIYLDPFVFNKLEVKTTVNDISKETAIDLF